MGEFPRLAICRRRRRAGVGASVGILVGLAVSLASSLHCLVALVVDALALLLVDGAGCVGVTGLSSHFSFFSTSTHSRLTAYLGVWFNVGDAPFGTVTQLDRQSFFRWSA